MIKRIPYRIRLLFGLLIVVLVTLHCSWLGDGYSCYVYPVIARLLGSLSQLVPFAIGDVFIALAVGWLVACPFYLRFRRGRTWKGVMLYAGEYLLWIYTWFYLAWGLNYAQSNFYRRTGIRPKTYSEAGFKQFANRYIDRINAAYVCIDTIDQRETIREIALSYRQPDRLPGIHPLFCQHPKPKTMLFTPLASMVGITGSMAPFFCEFTVNGDALPPQYPALYAHELAHFQGIARESEANLYSYLACINARLPAIRFSGYLSILPHVLSNARRLMEPDDYRQLYGRLRPEIVDLLHDMRQYWADKYSPFIGRIQDFFYDLYLKGNKIGSGRKNYSEVIGLILSIEDFPHADRTQK